MIGNVLGGEVALDLAGHLVPVHAWHHDVEQDEVGRLLRHDGERFLAAGGGQEEKAFRREHDFQQLLVVAFIVHDQDAWLVIENVGARVQSQALPCTVSAGPRRRRFLTRRHSSARSTGSGEDSPRLRRSARSILAS